MSSLSIEFTLQLTNVFCLCFFFFFLQLHDKYQEFVTDSQREELSARLQEVEDWLYEDGEDETKGVYIAKLDELKKVSDISQVSDLPP